MSRFNARLVIVAYLGQGVVASVAPAQSVPRGVEFQVNTYTPSLQFAPAVGMDDDGNAVVTWTSFDQDGSGSGVFAQRYDVAGGAVGTELQVNVVTAGNQSDSAVAMTGGRFVVVWESDGQDGSGYGLFARLFDVAGAAVSTEFQINSVTLGGQADPAVGIGLDGRFVVVWNSYGQDGSGFGVFARRFDAGGTGQGAELQVNVYTTGAQRAPTVSLDDDGDFVVAWSSAGQDGSSYGVFARRFGSSGAALGGELQVNARTQASEYDAAVGVAGGGDFVVTWTSSDQDAAGTGVFARRFDAAGTVLGGDFQVNLNTLNNERKPAIGVDQTGGFVVAWASYAQNDPIGVFARQFGAGGSGVGGEFQVNSYTPEQFNPAVGAGGTGRFMVAWGSFIQDGSNAGVFAQRFGAPATLDVDGDGEVGPLTDGLLLLRFLFGFNGATLITGAVDTGDCTRCAAPAIEAYLTATAATSLALATRGGELAVNTYTANAQSSPAVSVAADGDFVVAWVSDGQDGSNLGVFARRFDSAGVRQAAEFQVNQVTANYQNRPAVGMRDDGAFVIAWQSNLEDGSDYGIFARRFDASGVSLGGEFQVNTHSPNAQSAPAVGMDSSGDFVVVWQSSNQDGSFYGVFGRRFDEAGTALASEFQVNSFTPNFQRAPAVDMSDDGSFVVAWHNHLPDATYYNVLARRFDSAGNGGVESLVNVFSSNAHRSPTVGVDGAGAFVVAWTSDDQDGSSTGVFGRRMDSTGAIVGAEFRINGYVPNSQSGAHLAMADDGDFVVSWDSFLEDGDGLGVFARSFGGDGSSLPADFQVNSHTPDQQRSSALDSDGTGSFVVAWASQGQDGGDYGVFARRLVVLGLLDVDGDGSSEPLTDGLLVLRFLFGFSGPTLVSGAVDLAGCTRCDAPAIQAYLQAL